MTMTTDGPDAPPTTPALEASFLFRDLADHLSLHPHLVPVSAMPAQFTDWGSHKLQVMSSSQRGAEALVPWADSLGVTELVIDRYPDGSAWVKFTAEFALTSAEVVCPVQRLNDTPLQAGDRVAVGDLR